MRKEVENKTIIYVIANAIYLLVTAFVALGCAQIFEDKTGLILGIVLMVVGVPFAIVYKNNPFVCLFMVLLNSIFTGMALSVCYTATSFSISFLDCVLSWLIAVGAFLVLMGTNKIPFIAKHKVLKYIINLALVITLILVNAFAFEIKENDMFMLSGILSVVSVAFVFVMQRKDYTFKALCKSLSICSYSVFVVVAVAAIIIISEGDAVDGIDIDDSPKSDDVDLGTALMVASDATPLEEDISEEEKKKEQTEGENNG